ncbi:MAG: EAL domain-containing protein [Colwelliaceae bacterium]|nr:EAL domain-containing protein [Colwelliaceae bacterium]
MVEEKVKSIIDSLSHAVTDNFIETISLSLANVIKADFVFVAKLNPEHSLATTISVASQGKVLENFSYDLKSTPCENTSNGEVCTHIYGTQEAYPDDQLLIDMDIAGYVGIPLKDSQDHTDSILVALFHKPIKDVNEVTSLFLLFSGMIKKEMEKQKLITELNIRNEVIEESKEAILVCNKNLKITSVNKAFTKITGYSFKEVEDENPNILSAGIHEKSFFKKMWKSIETTGGWSGEIWNKKKNGDIFPEWLSINSITDENNDVAYYVAFFFDITKRKESEAKIFKQANYDLLTGIANRFLFLDKLSLAILSTKRNQSKSAILYLDLDLFKEVNDIYGQELGDKLLIKTSERLQSYVTETDCVARITGDGFAILLNNIESSEVIDNLVTRILIGFSKPFSVDDIFLHCTLSIGITTFDNDTESASGILKKAESAMYHAKDNGRNSFSYFTQDMQNIVRHKLSLKKQLSNALKNRSLSVVFQPIISISEKKVSKFEALVRWNNDGEWISPVEFIPIAEEFSLIKQLGEYVLSEACQQLKKLKAQGFNDIVFNINRSVYEIPLNKSENDQWLVMINLYGLSPTDICFELTESALAPDKRNNEILFNQLRESGCTIALDDFGTGYSSLSYIRRIPLDYLKIDKSFIYDMSTNQDDNILVSTIIAMSKALGKKVVAEGVETREQLHELTELGCDYAQGYYFAKPMNSEEMQSYLTNFKYD